MDPIEGVSGSSGATGVSAVARAASARGFERVAAAASPIWQEATVPPARIGKASEDDAAVRPSIVGADGRFEKFILAVQALRLDYGPGSMQTQSTKEMRAAVEEIFSIDGLPQAFPTAAVLEPALAGSAPSSGAEETAPGNSAAPPPDPATEVSQNAPEPPDADAPQA